MRGERGELLLELHGLPHVVRVEEADVLAASVADTEVASGAHPVVALVRMRGRPDPGVERGVPAGDVPARVGRTVVDDEQLPVGAGLRADAVDRLGEEGLAVV